MPLRNAANAKTARDQIKDHGHDNYVFYDPELHQSRRSSCRATLERALRHAMEKNQREFLKTYQCHEVQGFYFFPPLPEKSITQLLQRQSEKSSTPLSWCNPVPIGFAAGRL